MPNSSQTPPQVPSRAALFRFQVVSAVLSHELRGESRADAIAEVAQLSFASADERARRVSERTIYRWLQAFADRDLGALEPAGRPHTASSVVLPKVLLDFVRAEKDADLRASLPEILRRAREAGVIGSHEPIDRSTLWRACVRMGVPVVRRKRAKTRDSRRFAYPHRMNLVLCDGKHFRAGAGRLRRVAMVFLDDATRMGLHLVVGPAESKALFLRGLFEMVQHHGLPGIVYLDHGPGYIAADTQAVIAQLPALLIHGEVKYPEGHGKIEKFNQTFQEALLRHLDGRPDVDPDCGALELRLRHWLREIYNHTEHESLAPKQTPWQRFAGDRQPLTFPSSFESLRERFVLQTQRSVSHDHVLALDGVNYETPRGLAGTRVQVWRQVLDGTVWVLHPDRSGRLVRLQPVDLTANARAHRGQPTAEDDTAVVLTRSAADMAFARDFQPIVGPDGGFADRGPEPGTEPGTDSATDCTTDFNQETP